MTLPIDTVVVGGGMAGLTAATSVARAGGRVTLLEKGANLGGRAASQRRDGFTFNLGPHALYRGGAGIGVLRELGVPFAGRVPAIKGSLAVSEGKLHLLPVDPPSLVATGLLGLREKWRAGRLLAALPRLDAAALEHRSVREWLGGEEPRVRALFEALVRVSTYANDPDRLSAGTAVAQLQRAFAGVLYLDEGWQTLVDGLRAAALGSGVRIERAQVAEVARAEAGWRVRTAAGRLFGASSVVLAVSPQAARAIAGPTLLLGRVPIPVRAATLDLALRRVPRPDHAFALGIDRPLYFSLHSATARLAPAEGGLIHAAAYLGSEAPEDAAALERELEGLFDLLQPGWRDEVVHRRFLPDLVVAHALPTAAQGGTAGRPGPAVPGAPGLFLAGDWVGPEGLLVDASLASARAAASALVAEGREMRASA